MPDAVCAVLALTVETDARMEVSGNGAATPLKVIAGASVALPMSILVSATPLRVILSAVRDVPRLSVVARRIKLVVFVTASQNF